MYGKGGMDERRRFEGWEAGGIGKGDGKREGREGN